MKKIYLIQGFGFFPTDPDLLDIKQTEFPVKLVVQCNTIMDITMQCAMCWYIPMTLLFPIPRNTCLPSQSSKTCRTNNSPFDYFNRIASGDFTIMSRPKLHPCWSPWKLRFWQKPLHIKCLSAYFYWSDRCILHQECLIP